LLDATAGTAVGSGLAGLAGGTIDHGFVWPAHKWLLILAIAAQVFGWLLIGYALPRLPALTTSVLLMVQPVGALIWGGLIFSERLSALQGAGVGLVLLGVAAINVRGSIKPPGALVGRPRTRECGRCLSHVCRPQHLGLGGGPRRNERSGYAHSG
jgi:drug/metabolite transporter (DMT)-like permease